MRIDFINSNSLAVQTLVSKEGDLLPVPRIGETFIHVEGNERQVVYLVNDVHWAYSGARGPHVAVYVEEA